MSSFIEAARNMNGMILGSAHPENFMRKLGVTANLTQLLAWQRSQHATALATLDKLRIKPARPRLTATQRIDSKLAEIHRGRRGEVWKAAVHEAGHAALARAAGLPVFGLTASSDGTGCCEIGRSRKHGAPPRVLVAGAVAEFLNQFGTQAAPRVTSLAMSAGERQRFETACRAFGVDRQAVVDGTARELRSEWGRVERIAGRLSQYGRIDGDELTDLLS